MYDDMTSLSRVQIKGQITIPSELRKKYGLKEGALVSFVATDKGILITPQEVIAMDVLDKIGHVLKEKGVSLDEVIESGRYIRGVLTEEKYNLKSDT